MLKESVTQTNYSSVIGNLESRGLNIRGLINEEYSRMSEI